MSLGIKFFFLARLVSILQKPWCTMIERGDTTWPAVASSEPSEGEKEQKKKRGKKCSLLVHIGHVVRMSVSGYRGQRFKPRQCQHDVSLSKTLYLYCFSPLSCKMSTRWGHPHKGC